MALHRAEQVIQAAVAALTGLPTTGANVFDDRDDDEDALQPDELPGLVVSQGDDERLTEYSHDVADWRLEINVDIVVAETGPSARAPLNAIRNEITPALAADHTLGLAFVQNVEEIGALAPDRAAADRTAGRMRMVWAATYRRSRTDPST